MLFCTVAGRAQRAGAIVLARSVKQHHPHSRFVLCLVECYVPPEAAEPFDDIVVVGGHGGSRDSNASLAAAKAFVMTRLVGGHDPIAPPEGETIVYLDPDTKLYAPLSELAGWTDQRAVMAVPFRLEPEPGDEGGRELDRLRRGYLHAGFLVVRNRQEARTFAQWWKTRIEHSLYGPDRDACAADKWLSVGMVPHRLSLLRHPAYHVAAWNIDERRRCVTAKPDGSFTVQAEPLRTFCFADPAGLLAKWRDDPGVGTLVAGYEQELERARRLLG